MSSTSPEEIQQDIERTRQDLKDNVEALGKDFGIKGIDGTGPYCFQSWEPRNQTVATRHEAYKWGPPVYANRGPAKFQRVVWKIVPEEAARLATMASCASELRAWIQREHRVAPTNVTTPLISGSR